MTVSGSFGNIVKRLEGSRQRQPGRAGKKFRLKGMDGLHGEKARDLENDTEKRQEERKIILKTVDSK